VKNTSLVLPGLWLCLAWCAAAQNASKVGVVNIQGAIVSTKEGQKAASDMQARFNPKKTALDRRQAEIGQLQDQLNRGRNTLSEDAQQTLVREIDQKTKSLNRETEDDRAELEQEEQKIVNELGGRIVALIDKYAKENGYTLIVDLSSPQSPVLYHAPTLDITKEIIELYDKNTPTASAAPASGAATPGVPAAKPAAAPK
jgi:outer membrane protein